MIFFLNDKMYYIYIYIRGLNLKYYTKKRKWKHHKALKKNHQHPKMPKPLTTSPQRTNTANSDQLGTWSDFASNVQLRPPLKFWSNGGDITTAIKDLSHKRAPDLESKAIGPQDSWHKSKKHPWTHEPPEQTPKPVQNLDPPITWCQNPKADKRRNSSAKRTSSNTNESKQATKTTYITTTWIDRCTPQTSARQPQATTILTTTMIRELWRRINREEPTLAGNWAVRTAKGATNDYSINTKHLHT